MASLNTTVRQMTKMFQSPICLSKNDQNLSKKNSGHTSIIHLFRF